MAKRTFKEKPSIRMKVEQNLVTRKPKSHLKDVDLPPEAEDMVTEQDTRELYGGLTDVLHVIRDELGITKFRNRIWKPLGEFTARWVQERFKGSGVTRGESGVNWAPLREATVKIRTWQIVENPPAATTTKHFWQNPPIRRETLESERSIKPYKAKSRVNVFEVGSYLPYFMLHEDGFSIATALGTSKTLTWKLINPKAEVTDEEKGPPITKVKVYPGGSQDYPAAEVPARPALFFSEALANELTQLAMQSASKVLEGKKR